MVTLVEAGQASHAYEQLNEQLLLDPQCAKLRDLAGRIAEDLGEMQDALRHARQAVDLEPTNAGYHTRLGMLLAATQPAESEAVLQESLRLLPSQPNVLDVLGILAEKRHDLAAAEDYWIEAIEADPNDIAALCNWAQMLLNSGRADEALILLRPAAELVPQNVMVQLAIATCENYVTDRAEEDLQSHIRFGDAVRARIPTNLPPIASTKDEYCRGKRPIRIGYLSPDFKDHSVASFLLPLFQHHDRHEFDVSAFALNRREDKVTQQFRQYADHWHSVGKLRESQLVPYIRNCGIDVLVDCGGLFEGGRPFALEQRMAPVQAHYIGYPNTLGLQSIDFRIVDSTTDPEGTDCFAVESLLRLRNCFLCYTPRCHVALPTRKYDRPLTFGCFNALSKISSTTLDVWAEVLRLVLDSRILMKAGALQDKSVRARITESFQERGIATERVELRGFTETAEEHLEMYGECDIALDTFPYNGTTTTCESIYMGTPVITLIGRKHAGRVGASLLGTLGHADWIAETKSAYISRAVELARDRNILKEYHQSLRAELAQSPIMNAESFARTFEQQLRDKLCPLTYPS